MIHWLSASKVIKCCSPKSLSGSSSPTMSSYLETFSFIAPFISCPQSLVLPVPVFPLTPHPTPSKPLSFQALICESQGYCFSELLSFLAETLHKQQYFAPISPSPTSLYLDRKGKAITPLPSLSRSRAVSLMQRTLLHVLSWITHLFITYRIAPVYV